VCNFLAELRTTTKNLKKFGVLTEIQGKFFRRVAASAKFLGSGEEVYLEVL
jgi:hypothetical protein